MPYNLNFPQSLDFMRDSQPLMLENYASISGFISQDHVPFNNIVNTPGDHLQMTFPQWPLTPNGPTDPIGQNTPILYAKVSPISSLIQLFIENAANLINGFSDGLISGPLQPGISSWVTLPSGITLKWTMVLDFDQEPINTHTWSAGRNQKPFTTQYWAAIFPTESHDFLFAQATAYVTNISNPASVQFTFWSNSQFNTHPNGPVGYFIFAIGI